MPHSSLPLPHPILSLPSSFSPSTPPSLCSMPYISSESASHPPPLHCHILYTSSPASSNFSISSSPPPALLYLLSFVSILLSFFLLTPTDLVSDSPLPRSFNMHSFGCSSNSSSRILVTSLHTQFFSMYFTSAFDTLFNLTSPYPKSARRHYTSFDVVAD